MANQTEESKERVRIKYYEDNMPKSQHMLAYFIIAILLGGVLFVYYHSIIVSVAGGLLLAVYGERIFAAGQKKKRQRQLRLQFKEFLEIISISVSGGAGRSLENAITDSVHDLESMFNAESDIVREIKLIVNDYHRAGIPMVQGFKELGERSEVDDIMSFATIYQTIEGRSSDFGFIINQTHDIIQDKVEITQEIETSISAAKSETYMMLVLPIVMIGIMSVVGSDFMGSLFTTATGRLAATIGVALTMISFVIAYKATDIEI